MPGEKKEEEKKKLSPLTLMGGAAGAVLTMVIGARLKTAGTIPGAALGSIVSSGSAFYIEERARRARAKLKARKDQDKINADPEHHPLQVKVAEGPFGEGALVRARTRMYDERSGWTPRQKLAFLGGAAALFLASSLGSLLVIESATGQTLHSDLSNDKQYGSTFGGYTAQSPSPAPPSPAATISPSQSVSPSVTLSASPSPTLAPSPFPDLSPTVIPSYTGASQ